MGLKRMLYSIREALNNFILCNFHPTPNILTNEETIKKLANEGYSISRFGDGELLLLTKEAELAYQHKNDILAKRLEQILKSNQKKLLIGIPNVFDKNALSYRENNSKLYWKEYLKKHRKIWYSYLNFNQIYASSTFTRNYIVLNDKSKSYEYFKKVKQIWHKRDIIVIEGRFTRVGIGNDLLDNANSIKRIIAPSEDAFDFYDEILKEAKKYEKERLYLIALGPTATVLAYDLYNLGYQAIDIGQIDIEYEWFLKGSKEKIKIDNKYVLEADGIIKQDDFINELYESQILVKIF